MFILFCTIVSSHYFTDYEYAILEKEIKRILQSEIQWNIKQTIFSVVQYNNKQL